MLEAVAAACRAAAGAGVEAERAGGVSALARCGRLGEKVADAIEGPDIAGGVRARRLADRRLIDEHHIAHLVAAFQRAMRAGRFGRAAFRLQQGGVEDILYERRLARARDARDAHQPLEREAHVDRLEVVLRRAFEREEGARRRGRAPFHRLFAPRQVVRSQRALRGELLRRAEEHDLAAALARTGSHVEDAIGGVHDLRVVLDYDERIAGVAQALHDVDHAAHVARVQADRRLVEHEEGIHQRGAERGGQVDALDFTARERARLPIERQVAETDFAEIAQARAHFGEQQIRGFVKRRGQREALEERLHVRHRQEHQLVDVAAVELPEQRIGLQPRAAARLALRVRPVFREQHADVHLVRLGLQPLEEAAHAIPGAGPGFAPAFPLGLAFQHPGFLGSSEITERHIERNLPFLGVLLEIVLALLEARALPRTHRAFAQRLRFVGHHQAEVDADHAAEAAAGLARAERRIERERRRRRFAVVDIAVGAMQIRREAQRLRNGDCHHFRVGFRIDVHSALTDTHRRLERIHDARLLGARDAHAVLDDLDAPLRLAVELGVALRLQELEHLGFAEILRHRHREGDEEALVGPLRQRPVDRLRRVAHHRPAAAAAVELRRACEKELQVVVQLRHRADRRARGAHRVRLVDGDCRRNAFDCVDLRLVHAVEELPRVRAEGLDVAPLAFGIQRVEDERRLPGARNARDDDELAGRDR